MAQLWLPIKEPATGRETILYIPGASRMDKSQLQEIIAKHTEKIHDEAKQLGPKPQRRYSKKEVAGAIRDFRDRLLLSKQRSGPSRYYQGR